MTLEPPFWKGLERSGGLTRDDGLRRSEAVVDNRDMKDSDWSIFGRAASPIETRMNELLAHHRTSCFRSFLTSFFHISRYDPRHPVPVRQICFKKRGRNILTEVTNRCTLPLRSIRRLQPKPASSSECEMVLGTSRIVEAGS